MRRKMLLILLLLSCLLVGCEKQNNTDEKVSHQYEEDLTEKNQYEDSEVFNQDLEDKTTTNLESDDTKPKISEEDEIKEMISNFAEAYFRGNTQEISKYIDDTSNVNDEDIFDSLETFNFKGDLSNISELDELEVQYEYKVADADSYDYLGIVLSKESGKWKIVDYYIEK